MINPVNEISSLSRTRGLGGVSSVMGSSSSAGQVTPGQQTGMSFAEVLGQMTTDTMTNLKQAETSSIEGIQGKANTREVVDSILQAEQSLQTAVAIRDKIVNAWLEVTKMQI